jgi:hypothetical protein
MATHTSHRARKALSLDHSSPEDNSTKSLSDREENFESYGENDDVEYDR